MSEVGSRLPINLYQFELEVFKKIIQIDSVNSLISIFQKK